ncbi:MAG: RNA ligase partner protein [Candidatus Omnitrophica bacterium 4484_70.1]|nr:MAG: RNA ligase partner protein [Candidatus Omnitrophica bacterium 4484_70.1]
MKIVLDTNIFVNPSAFCYFGKSAEEALNNFLEKLKRKKKISCFMPPSVYRELEKFVNLRGIPKKKLLLINKKPPSQYEMPVPAMFIYEFIEDSRMRINKGLRTAEKFVRKSKEGIPVEELIKTLRNEYRIALREGTIDSKEDFDLLLLTREIEGVLATSDKGLIKWAYKLGINCISPEELKELIE